MLETDMEFYATAEYSSPLSKFLVETIQKMGRHAWNKMTPTAGCGS
jgi:hypothetical protein